MSLHQKPQQLVRAALLITGETGAGSILEMIQPAVMARPDVFSGATWGAAVRTRVAPNHGQPPIAVLAASDSARELLERESTGIPARAVPGDGAGR